MKSISVMFEEKLLTRDQFREQTFERDNHKCVFCGEPAVDAHHILERRLWGKSQGYFASNGASVCQTHHIMCETTEIAVEDVRLACGIEKYSIPEHLYSDHIYDKWGNIVLPYGRRMKGELFYDESVQKILKQGKKLDLFTDYVKYPRTYHLPWSPGVTDDDRIHKDMSVFDGKRIIVTEKLDGENSSFYRDYYHARSIDGRSHPSRSWAKAMHSQICGDIPEGWRVCAENLYAEHSIRYDDLESYVYGFFIWNNKNECLSWDETVEWFDLFGMVHVPVLYDGIYDEQTIKALWSEKDRDSIEGYVIRTADGFAYKDFKKYVAKFVRKGHVSQKSHWRYQKVIPNGLKS
jgi:hypothetical protein